MSEPSAAKKCPEEPNNPVQDRFSNGKEATTGRGLQFPRVSLPTYLQRRTRARAMGGHRDHLSPRLPVPSETEQDYAAGMSYTAMTAYLQLTIQEPEASETRTASATGSRSTTTWKG
ncbi:hypothetical protein ACJZ2D_012365 [Fusarium nematophilum]